MKILSIIIFILTSTLCFAQKKEMKLDSVKLNQWEQTQLDKYLKGDKAREKAQLQERIIFLQRELDLMNEAETNLTLAPIARENKKGQPISFRNGYLIFQVQ